MFRAGEELVTPSGNITMLARPPLPWQGLRPLRKRLVKKRFYTCIILHNPKQITSTPHLSGIAHRFANQGISYTKTIVFGRNRPI